MSVYEQNRMLDCLRACGSSEDDALETVIMMLEGDDEQEVLQQDLLLELNECY